MRLTLKSAPADNTQNTSGDLEKIALQLINAATYNKDQNTY